MAGTHTAGLTDHKNHKVQKHTGKKKRLEQPLLGKFFEKAKEPVKAKAKAKGKGKANSRPPSNAGLRASIPPTESIDTGLVDDPIVVDDTSRCQEKVESTAQIGVASATHHVRPLGRSPDNLPGNPRSDGTKKVSSVDPGMVLPGHNNHQAK